MDPENNTAKKQSLIQRYWWVSLGFILPFLIVGGIWALMRWAKVIDSAGRDGIDMDAFAPEAVNAFWNGLIELGFVSGVVGLMIVVIATYSYRFFNKTEQ